MHLDYAESKLKALSMWAATRSAAEQASARIKRFLHAVRLRVQGAWFYSRAGWDRLTAGMEIEELWSQFKIEAGESSRLYTQEVKQQSAQRERSWKNPFKIFGALCWSVLRKLSPARRLFLLVTIILAILAIIGFEFLVFTRTVEFALAFAGLLILLVLVLGDHISMKRDIEIAREIQRWLVPRRPPEVPGIDIAFLTHPAKTIGGDYYDAFLRRTDGPLLIAVADVAGKSVPAAMLMATFQASLRALASASGSLAELVGGLNRQVCANSQTGGRFTTAFLAELNSATGELIYLCAGHNPPILKRGDGSFERLKSDNIPLGIEIKEHYQVGFTTMEAHDLLVIYTDGVTEARNDQEKEFGEARLLSVLEFSGDDRSSLILSNIMRGLDEFVGAAPQHDDITCMVLRRN
jgi:sigma-B regulation protein RsbU (phosphoserine phosphatase)